MVWSPNQTKIPAWLAFVLAALAAGATWLVNNPWPGKH